jgi:hypothetical protein
MSAPENQSQFGGRTASREYCRGEVAIIADIRVAGSNKTKVKVLDISQTGFRMECLSFLSSNQTTFLSIPGFEQLESRIIWQTEWIYGCQFARPLYMPVYEHIVRTFPAIEMRQTNTLDGLIYGVDAGLRWGNSY